MKLRDFEIGQTFTTKPVTVTNQSILDFGHQNDPQYFHIDEEAAKTGPFGGLIASGFQTLSIVWVEFIKQDVLGRDCLGGMGMNQIVWRVPVYPGDELSGTFSVASMKELDQVKGILNLDIKVFNHKGKEVMSCETMIMMKS
ncbi:MaoC/PaaZ C-terminal domain-containing protein [Piscibacillus halophilus]|uniref:Acyl dehydratase n=1 Tax=Piscibacillus halophilus TaxID=571933 RepID=A0A1H9CJF3_9BACI|nr:MaoC/PaaZ C-terminal domain-containing protein [Piscibacillus halophilus]SEQ01284.1 Acyl dehydratase [Piscibacillus halophilus]